MFNDNKRSEELSGSPPLIAPPKKVRLLSYFPIPLPFSKEEEAHSAYRTGLYYETTAENEKTRKLYRSIAERKKCNASRQEVLAHEKTRQKARALLNYWDECERSALVNYTLAVELMPGNVSYQREYVRALYGFWVKTDPKNEEYQKVLQGLEIEI